MIAPFIKPILSEGTFYTFSSSYEDITFSMNDIGKKCNFSKFALLNLPPQLTPTNNENFLQLGSIAGAFNNISGTNRNKDFAESLQNYCLNFEAAVLSDSSYDKSKLKSVSERIFWKWLKEIGGIRWQEAGNSSTISNRFKEEDSSSSYLKVVQYLGFIDVTNNLKNNINSYSEIYIYVPSDQGNTPEVLFKTEDDGNYSPNKIWQHNPDNLLNGNLIWNRTLGDIHPGGLDFKGHWDSELTSPSYSISVNGTPGTPYPSNAINSFFSGSFTDTINDLVVITDGSKTYSKRRNRLDGVEIDWNTSNYKNIKNNFKEWSQSGESSDYQFNTVLLYYDIEDHLGNVETNLYGVLFLDKWESISGNGAIIPSFKKFKPSVNGQGGNSFAFKQNIKIEGSFTNSSNQYNINESNNIAMTMFMDALTKLKDSSSLLNNHIKNTILLSKNIELLKDEVQTYINGNSIEDRMQNLETLINESVGIFSNNDFLNKQINTLRNDLSLLLNNNLSQNLSYDLSPFTQSEGIELIKANNKILIKNSKINPELFLFNENNFVSYPTYYKIDTLLKNNTNLYRFNISNIFVLDKDIKIYIDDSIDNWKLGQTIKFSFKNLKLNNSNGDYTIEVLSNYTSYKSLCKLTSIELINSSYIFEIICIDENNLLFDIDIIKS